MAKNKNCFYFHCSRNLSPYIEQENSHRAKILVNYVSPVKGKHIGFVRVIKNVRARARGCAGLTCQVTLITFHLSLSEPMANLLQADANSRQTVVYSWQTVGKNQANSGQTVGKQLANRWQIVGK